jgi:hypothetical protein
LQKEKTLALATQKYTFTGKYKPFDHQRKTALFFTKHKKSFCFNEQGTGKTASAIWASDYLMQQGKVNRVLVICPLSIMDSAWRNDLFDFAPHRTVAVAHGEAKKRKSIIEQGTDYVVINYDGVEIVADVIKKGGFDLESAKQDIAGGHVAVDDDRHTSCAKSVRRLWFG